MALEDQLDRLAASIEALTAAVTRLQGGYAALDRPAVQSAAASAAAPAAATAPATPGEPAASKPRGRPRVAAPSAEAAPAAATAAIQYHGEGGVREAILSLAEKKGHTATVALLAKFGAKTGRDLKESQYADALAAVKAALAA
jgi:pilus assembly protein FimV